MEQASGQVLGVDAQGNMLFRLVKPVMGIFHHTQQDQSNSMGQVGMTLQGLADNTMVQVQQHHGQQQVHDLHGGHHGQQVQEQMTGSEVMTQTHHHVQSHMQQQPHMETHIMQVSDPGAGQQSADAMGDEGDMMMSSSLSPQGEQHVTHMPFAEVSSLLDPNMKGSKARKYLISYEEIKRRLQSPEKMSLRSLAAYTRVSRGPASKKSLLESLNVLGLTPSTTTAVSSSFSKLTEGDTKALCADMKDFAQDYVDYGSMAKHLIPETNTVQHWSKIIETKNHLEDMRKCFRDPGNSGAFHNVTHGLGLGMLDVALDMVGLVIDRQIRILSGAAASDPSDSGPPMRRVRRRHRKPRPYGGGGGDNGALDGGVGDMKLHRMTSGGGVGMAVGAKTKVIGGRGRGGKNQKKKARLDGAGADGNRSTAAIAAGLAAVGGGGVGGPSQMMTTMTNVTHSKAEEEETMENSVLTLVSVGYEAISTGLGDT